MSCHILVLLVLMGGFAELHKITQNVLFRPLPTSRSKWTLTLVHDINPFLRFTSDLAIDVGRTFLAVDEIMSNYSIKNNSQEYVSTFNTLKKEVTTVRDEIEDLLDGVNDFQTLSTKHARSKRALIPFVGKALSRLFGTVSTEDLDVIRKNIEILAANQHAITQVVSESLSLLNVSRLQISENRQQVNILSKSLHKLDLKIESVVKQFRKKLISLEGFIHLFLRMKMVLDDIKNMFLRAELYAEDVKIQLNLLLLGHLSPSIIKPGSLRKLLIEIQRQLPPSVMLPKDPRKNLWHYCRILNCITFIEDNKIIVVVNIPLLDSEGSFEIFKIHNFPMPMTNKKILSKSKATFKMVASYRLEAEVIAINNDRTKYAILDRDETKRCSDPLIGFCQIRSPIYPINLSQLCIVALFTNNKEKISQLCKVYVKPNCILPMAKYITNGLWIVVTQRPIIFSIICHQTSFVHKSVTVRPPIQSIQLSPTCKAQNDYLELPALYSNESTYFDPTSFEKLTSAFNQSMTDLWQPFVDKCQNYKLTKLPPKLENIENFPLDELAYEMKNLQRIRNEKSKTWSLWKLVLIGLGILITILIIYVLALKYCKSGGLRRRFQSFLRSRETHKWDKRESADLEMTPRKIAIVTPQPAVATAPLLHNDQQQEQQPPLLYPQIPEPASYLGSGRGRMMAEVLRLARNRRSLQDRTRYH
ncbi:hypothetical protein LOTGIDRAFT_171626 [Lottia gigantea]|uniref:Envelope fusion protein n=1 Tax=Lottia gigantea TaxID=225164 RepID=V4AGU5_LOTGI|nr:hypothetical protein LOTGIDRAFT_171626 [Lottia gigantea]ESP03279.1 hypothetical protein LOTGIDRAFT_171626 [Lottia gigantea]